ncbi:DUF262 domain-containing protein [Clostridium sp. 'deep sea']|uniref:DUF262 domain-containing protein n=1 Tax=Clostridium sp. 'deep sea' TaxID=2779445 RepID=UPI0018964031|nr:DUF262 domain-containing protein [Clostridium sp. 'deep sea']QOR34752.1 DUF262 domain-containing protein [Clostridium sp. 'deep sea']
MNKYETTVFKFSKLKSKVSLPKYQRSYVWQESKKLKLINTIKRGLPVGTVLLSKRDGEYLIVDGLQRIATFKDFEKDPYKYLEETEISDDDVVNVLTSSDVSEELYNNYSPKSKKAIRNTTKELIIEGIKKNSELETYKKANIITNNLINKTSILCRDSEKKIHEKIYELLDKVNNIFTIDNYEIPAIIFTGSDKELVDVFKLLNSTGTSLSKYDVFSASWNDVILRNVDDDVLDAVLSKYETSMSKSGIEIHNFSSVEFKENKEITLFEYAYSIGKLIGEKTKRIFKSKSDDLVDSLGFSLLAGVYNVSNKEMVKLPDAMQSGNFDFNQLKDSLVKSAKKIEEILIQYISMYKKNYACHSELQLASYIITYHRLQYKITNTGVKRVKSNNDKIKKFTKYLPNHYVYDIYRKAWSGSGDTKLDDLVIDDSEQVYNTSINSSRYLYAIDKSEFKNVISSWINEQNSKDTTSISKEVKLFHNCIFKDRDVRYNNSGKDFEHIIPKKRFEELKNKRNIKIPISSPCNITIIPEYDNRMKKDKTYYEYEEVHNGVLKRYSIEELDKYNYPRRNKLEFIHNKKLNAKDYEKFINLRKYKILDDFMKAFYK